MLSCYNSSVETPQPALGQGHAYASIRNVSTSAKSIYSYSASNPLVLVVASTLAIRRETSRQDLDHRPPHQLVSVI